MAWNADIDWELEFDARREYDEYMHELEVYEALDDWMAEEEMLNSDEPSDDDIIEQAIIQAQCALEIEALKWEEHEREWSVSDGD